MLMFVEDEMMVIKSDEKEMLDLFCWVFLWRLMKVDEEDDEEVEWRWWIVQTLTVF